MFKRLLGLSLIFGMAATAPPVSAAPNCGLRDAVVRQLETKYSERLMAGGLQNLSDTRAIMEIWASPESGTFTVLLTNPNGVSCIVAVGSDFFTVTQTPVPKGTAS